MAVELEVRDEQAELLHQYKTLSQQLAQAKREGRDLEALKAEHKRVYDRLQEISPRKRKGGREQARGELRAEAVTAQTELESLRQDWDDLLERADNYSPFVTWEWWWPWVKRFGGTNAPYLLLARDQDRRLLGGLPLAMMPRGRRRMLGFMGSRGGPDPAYLAPVADVTSREQALATMMQRLAADCGDTCCGWEWQQCPVNAKLGETLAAAAREGLQATVQVKRHYVHGDLPPTFDAYVDSVQNKNRRNYLRNQFERLEREWAKPELATHTTAAEARRIIPQMARYNIRKRQELGDYSRWNDPTFNSCLDEVIGLFAERGWLRLHTISVEGRLAAALVGWAYRGTFFAYQIGETNEHPELGLGQCVISHAIEASISEGLKRFEFLGEAHAWKQSYFPGLTGAATVLLGRDDCAYWSTVGWASLRRAAGRVVKGLRHGT